MWIVDVPPATVPISPPPALHRTYGRDDPLEALHPARSNACGSRSVDEVVVCGGRNDEKFRMKPLPDDAYADENGLGHPFHLPIAPGLALDGLSLSLQFGPGTKGGTATPPPADKTYRHVVDRAIGPSPR